jgi:hypothetical protein
MNDALAIERVRAIQASMVESARSYFLESELDDLRCLIRLTIEFFHHLQGEHFAPLIEDNLRYVCDSVFSGVDSFGLVSAAYRALPGARSTTVTRDVKSIDSLKEEFVSKYREFSDETDFEKRCRILLDLFKLQIVFAALQY